MLSFKRVPLVVAFSLAAIGAQAQTAALAKKAPPVVQVDSRFSQWVGCWRLEDDVIGSGLRVCVIPDQIYNVRMETLIGAQRGEVSSLVPDKIARQVNDPTCKGTERAEWSKDGLRIFRWADVTCGTESPRKLSSVIFMAEGPLLVEVQHVDNGQTQSVRAKRYRRAIDQSLPDGSIAPQPSIRTAETAMTGGWDVEDVIEASGKIPGDAVQAAITEVDTPFALNKKALVALSDAKVSEGVIDLMVALTYPKRLVVQRATSTGYSGYSPLGMSGMGGTMFDMFYSPIIPADCFSIYSYGYYSNFGGRCGWYNSAFGYNNYGFGYPRYGYGGYGYGSYDYRGDWVIVNGPTSNVPATAQPEGRVINGRGYTQIQTRQPEPTVSGRGYSNGTSTNSGGSNNGAGNGGSSGVSSGGYSSGSSGGGSSSGGDSGTRTAVTRPPGGGI